jgi:hypothetical protein
MTQDTIIKNPSLEDDKLTIERWMRVMARIGVTPKDNSAHGVVSIKPTATHDVYFDILDIVEGICDTLDRLPLV